ncbi:uncharacterized protein B0I36DRAFT_358296 [Microdochium trichocladiopsis]|uniref:ABM domain-containing protein n=1 Tax=Microdochium trichocladiopsis TaxID=1682393 RepID=A0A9P8YLC4_9PEZI|nr:uncharacterized protein B0I36DRAFT_358296 [Microdochium trichocladiopsis]KAH7041095.1 hypothetical protein B0I36DRAFT_358296 [Microdochium trichocladiopsis]
MPVTEIAHITLRDSSLPLELFASAARKALPIQDGWFEKNSTTANLQPTASSAEERGAAFFQQTQDPRKILITAHWASVEQHHTWIASAENKSAFGSLLDFIDLTDIDYFHVADVEAFSPSLLRDVHNVEGVSGSLLRIRRFVVAKEDKGFFEELAKSHLATSDGERRGGWRIEEDPEQPEDRAQFVIVDSCGQGQGEEEEEADIANATLGTSGGAASDLAKVILNASTRHYQRLC